jgi:hypothetical protein
MTRLCYLCALVVKRETANVKYTHSKRLNNNLISRTGDR